MSHIPADFRVWKKLLYMRYIRLITEMQNSCSSAIFSRINPKI